MNSLSSVATAVDSQADASSSNPLVTSSSVESTGPSFAQMLRGGTGSGFKRDAKKSTANKINPEEWPTPQPAESETELEGYVPVPHYRQSFSDAIALAFERAEHAEGKKNFKQ